MSKARKALIAGSLLGVGIVGAHEINKPSDSQKVARAQQQLLTLARHNAAHPPSPNTGGGMAVYEASGIAEDAKAIGEAKALTARRIAKLSFNKAFNEAMNVGAMVIDVSGMTKLPAKTVLEETLPQSAVTALDKKNIHFIYDSTEFNPIVQLAQHGQPLEGYIPLSFSDKPEHSPFPNSNYIDGQGKSV